MSHYYDAGREIASRRSDPRMWGDPYNYYYGNGGSFGGAGATGSWGAPMSPMLGMGGGMWGMPGAGLNPADPVSQRFINDGLPADLRSTTAIEGRDAEINLIRSGHSGSMVGALGGGIAGGALGGLAAAAVPALAALAWPIAVVAGIGFAIAGAHVGSNYSKGQYAERDMEDGDHQLNGSVTPFSFGFEEFV